MKQPYNTAKTFLFLPVFFLLLFVNKSQGQGTLLGGDVSGDGISGQVQLGGGTAIVSNKTIHFGGNHNYFHNSFNKTVSAIKKCKTDSSKLLVLVDKEV